MGCGDAVSFESPSSSSTADPTSGTSDTSVATTRDDGTAPPGTSVGTTGADAPGSTGSGSRGGATETSSSGGSSDTGANDPDCGNGLVEGDEECDDGNEVPEDGCEPECTLSRGSVVWERHIDVRQDDAAFDVEWCSDALFATGSSDVGAEQDLVVWRLNPSDGAEVWSDTFASVDVADGRSIAVGADRLAVPARPVSPSTSPASSFGFTTSTEG